MCAYIFRLRVSGYSSIRVLSQENIAASSARSGSSSISKNFSKFSRLSDRPHAPPEGLTRAYDRQVDHAPHKEILVVNRADIFREKRRRPLPLPAWQQPGFAVGFSVLLRPVVGRIVAYIQHWPRVPFVAGPAFPAQVLEVVQRHIGPIIPHLGLPILTVQRESKKLTLTAKC